MTIKDYKNMTNNELIEILNSFLTSEQKNTVENMTIGLKIKTDLLEAVKAGLVRVNPDIRVDVLEMKVADALARTKEATGSSLSLDKDGKLEMVNYIMSDSKVDSKNFEFMAQFNLAQKDLEQMLMESQIRAILEVSSNILEHLDASLVVVVKQRISGAKKLTEKEEDTMLKIA